MPCQIVPFAHAAAARGMTVENLRRALMARGALTPSGHLRQASPGETRAMRAELARRIAAEAPAGGE